MRIERIGPENRKEANCFLEAHWYTTHIAVRGELLDMTTEDGFALFDSGEMAALAMYRPFGSNALEITAFGSAVENKGYGGMLLETVVDYARESGFARVTLVTTNDNLNALRFYQKRLFALTRVYPGAVEAARALKPEIPLIGDNGIPLRDELELERLL